MLTKHCAECGAQISAEDWYEFIALKYCRSCAREVRRRQQAEWMREFRRKQREQNALTRQLCSAQQEEIERLRMLVALEREKVRELTDEIGGKNA